LAPSGSKSASTIASKSSTQVVAFDLAYFNWFSLQVCTENHDQHLQSKHAVQIIPYTEETNREIDDIKKLQEFDELSLDDEDKELDQYVTMVNTTRNPHTTDNQMYSINEDLSTRDILCHKIKCA
jgi:hypothetical protein